jgi:hypothetical protein
MPCNTTLSVKKEAITAKKAPIANQIRKKPL